ncbi:hypothetical protein FN846DRAFT_914916 [Sphaerosporella brunnea]|uniref:Uncharacterized protein n=1 Tax=Sphaerosporella brunnea TaxID=1250544 RepID=A0A5J5EDH7_9PEZI|nr:hypothetical protein FN846DRAFT_914916 [Sphaerosporella brunnea]
MSTAATQVESSGDLSNLSVLLCIEALGVAVVQMLLAITMVTIANTVGTILAFAPAKVV